MKSKSFGPLSMDEAIRRAEKLVEDLGAEYDERLRGHLRAVQQAVERGDRESAIETAHALKGEAGTFGWPLVSVVAGWLRQLLEVEEIACSSEPVRLHLDSLRLLVTGEMRHEHPSGQKLVRELYAVVDHLGILPAR